MYILPESLEPVAHQLVPFILPWPMNDGVRFKYDFYLLFLYNGLVVHTDASKMRK